MKKGQRFRLALVLVQALFACLVSFSAVHRVVDNQQAGAFFLYPRAAPAINLLVVVAQVVYRDDVYYAAPHLAVPSFAVHPTTILCPLSAHAKQT